MAETKIQMNIYCLPETRAKVEALGRLTHRNQNADVISWLVDEKFEELIGKLEPVEQRAPGDE